MSERPPAKPLRDVAAAVIQRPDGRVLLLQRGASAPTFPLHWGVLTGHVEPGEAPAVAALREIREEIGLEGRIERGGEPFQVDLGASIVRVWPFLCALDPDGPIVLADENQQYAWVPLAEVLQRETVPRLDQDFRALGLV